jgi:hypothetical protein
MAAAAATTTTITTNYDKDRKTSFSLLSLYAVNFLIFLNLSPSLSLSFISFG